MSPLGVSAVGSTVVLDLCSVVFFDGDDESPLPSSDTSRVTDTCCILESLDLDVNVWGGVPLRRGDRVCSVAVSKINNLNAIKQSEYLYLGCGFKWLILLECSSRKDRLDY